MKYMTAKEIRETWLKFFEDKGHKIEPSASLIPMGDKTLLWINAGVAPLKKYFDGSAVPPKPRLTNIQKCIRTNDIDNVGKTARHHTFFEMLGNFSIGDYFKEEAIEYGFELLTSNAYFGFPVDKLYMTYYPDDLVALNKWLSLGVQKDHLIPLESNFWEIGEGPSGPDTEIYFDRGEAYDARGKVLIEQDLDNERFIEIWNIVFSQYNAKPGTPRNEYKELPNKNIDTGAGLERFACVIQGTKTNFETDLFMPIIKHTEALSGIAYDGQMAFKVIADHIKTLTMAIADGAILSNEGRGYVLRRLLRRATKYGKKLGLTDSFLHLLVDDVKDIMAPFYPNVLQNEAMIKRVILAEENKFLETLSLGEKHLLEALETVSILPKEDAFKLYDTYGFPIELTQELAIEQGKNVDLEGFYELMEKQKELSRKNRTQNSSMKSQEAAYLAFKTPSTFVGYHTLKTRSEVIKAFDNGIVLDQTPFYATMGGQIADKGTINGYPVIDVVKLPNNQALHIIEETFDEGEMVVAEVDVMHRQSICMNHTATHLLHKALKLILGEHVNQQGSQVTNDTLRFDFNNYESVSKEALLKIEAVVNEAILSEFEVVTNEMPIEQAKKMGAMALFGEKYHDIVRVVNIGGYSIELCGGTHVKNVREINRFAITSFESIGSGIYRIEAVSGDVVSNIEKALTSYDEELESLMSKQQRLLDEIKTLDESFKYTFKTKPTPTGSYHDFIDYRSFIELIKEDNKQLEKILLQIKQKDALLNLEQYYTEGDLTPIIVVKDMDKDVLKQLVDAIYDKINAEAVCLINETEDKVMFLCKTRTLNANQMVKKAASISLGSGGGRPDFAQGGTSDKSTIDAIVESFKEWF
ncbi:MAG: alanine--tRNA ligase [Acholeplasma sp.]|nr:alanine--tRNA ligase [Acholeplasma sp.]